MSIKREVDMRTEELRKLPKVELHCHLDGSLSRTFFERRLGREVEETELQVSEDCGNLSEYLGKFRLPLACLQEAEAFTAAGYDILETMGAENVRYAEIRFAPLSSVSAQLGVRRMIEALLKGLERGRGDFGVEFQVIVCAMRHESEDKNFAMLKTAREFLDAGVCGADLAGAEAQYPMSEFMELFGKVKKLGMPFTLHAGECGEARNIVDAIEAGASRIGHGIAMGGKRDIQDLVRRRDIGIEMCPISNLQTKAVGSQGEYPLREFLDGGLPVTINTDNRTVSATSLTRELAFIQEAYGIRDEEILQCMENAVRVSFAEDGLKERLYRELRSPQYVL